MFTGLVRLRGTLIEEPLPSPHGGVALRIAHDDSLSEELGIGASLAVSGVCLTVVEMSPGRVLVELAPETLARTTLGELRNGSEVNLEPALKMGEALGGHWVQGHVDTTVELRVKRDLTDHRELTFHMPPSLRGHVVEKGSVTLDGVSLTVAGLTEDGFSVALIPHTLKVTTLSGLEQGDRVNLEVDILSKYVRRALETSGVLPSTDDEVGGG